MNIIFTSLLWITFLPFHIALDIVKYPLAPVAVELFSSEDKTHLIFPFKWLETLDNDLGGDSGWKNEHIEPGSDPYSDWNRIQWVWRNGNNYTNYMVFGIESKPEITPEFEPGLNVREDGYWLWRDRFDLFWTDKSQFEVMWGWHLYGIVDGRNKYTFTNRFQKSIK